MSHSPLTDNEDADQYLDNWNALATRIRNLQSLSGRERNCCFLNLGKGRFADVAAATGLNFADDGRGLAFTDWDQDGDIDIWTANRTGPRIRFLRNNSATTKNHLTLKLVGTSCNRDAIGARVSIILESDAQPILKSLRAGEGFLSQSSKWMHFGLGDNAQVQHVEVRWPGADEAEKFVGVDSDQRYVLKQSTGLAVRVDQRKPVDLPPSELPISMPTGEGRTLLTQKKLLGNFIWNDFENGRHDTATIKTPLLINLWASWCPTCKVELHEFDAAEVLNLSIVALCIDAVEQPTSDLADAKKIAKSLHKIQTGMASEELLRNLTQLHNTIIYRQRSLPLPCSFLIEPGGQLAAIYKGPVSAAQLRKDVNILDATPRQIASAATPFAGRDVKHWFTPHPLRIASSYFEGDYFDDAKRVLRDFVSSTKSGVPRTQRIAVFNLKVKIGQAQKDHQAQIDALQQLATLLPKNRQIQIDLAELFVATNEIQNAKEILAAVIQREDLTTVQLNQIGRIALPAGLSEVAQAAFSQGVKKSPDDINARFGLAMAYQIGGKPHQAIGAYTSLIEQAPNVHDAANNLAWLLATHQDATVRQPKRALELAHKICEATQFEKTNYLDTLAAAHAAAGQFEMARKTIQQGIAIAKKNQDEQTVEKLSKRLEHYLRDEAVFE